MRVKCSNRGVVVPTIGALLAIAALALSGSFAAAQGSLAMRTWVSDSGRDGDPCTRAKPCATFARAIAMTANNGEVDVASSGEYGTFKVGKSITIRSRGNHAGIQGNTRGVPGIEVNCGAGDCRIVLDGLDLNGLGPSAAQTGVAIEHAGRVHIENTNISNFAGIGIYVTDMQRLVVEDTTVSEATSDQGAGLAIIPNKQGMIATVRGRTFIDSDAGIRVGADSTMPTSVNVSDTLINNNDTGIATEGKGGATVRLNNNEITGDGTGLLAVKQGFGYAPGDQFVSFGNNNISGNRSDGDAPTTGALRSAPRR